MPPIGPAICELASTESAAELSNLSDIELTDGLFATLAGWEAVKQARGLVAADRVLGSEWQPPLLRGTVQEGSATYRAGLVIHSSSDAENLCPCRDSRRRGIICAHSVAVGLHYLKAQAAAAAPQKQAVAAERLLQPAAGAIEKRTAVAASARPTPNTERKALRRSSPEEKGEPLEIIVILPPNFAEAVARGKVMLYLEGAWRKGRSPLSALPRDTPFALNAQDATLLDALEILNEGDTPAMLMLNGAQFAGLLPKLAGHQRVTLGKTQEVRILSEPLRPAIRATLEPDGEIVLREGGTGRPLPRCLIRGDTAWVFADQTLRPLGLPAGLQDLMSGPMRIPRNRVPSFLNLEWPQIIAGCDVVTNFALDDFVLEAATPRFELHLAGGLAMLDARLSCFYGSQSASSLSEDSPWLADPESTTHYHTRNFAAEQAALARLLRCGFSAPDAQDLCHLNGQNLVLNFFAREYPRLEKEWRVTLEERLDRSTRQNLERVEPSFRITPSGEQWFEMKVDYATPGGERFDPADIQRLLRSGQSHVRLKNGRTALLDTGAVEDLQEVLLDCAPQQQAGAYRLDNAQAGFLDATLSQQAGWKVEAPSAWSLRAAQQRGEAKVELPSLGELDAVLRPYQKAGVAWLYFLRANAFGGILADEMGLGKTLQVLALFEALRVWNEKGKTMVAGSKSETRNPKPEGNPKPEIRRGTESSGSLPHEAASDSAFGFRASFGFRPSEFGLGPDQANGGAGISTHEAPQAFSRVPHRTPHLVVCPTSLVFNWAAEAAKFTPDLRALALHGPRRAELFTRIPEHDLIITSYALLRRDAAQYRGLEFDTVVLDEAQHIKNRQTQNAQAVKAIRAQRRLVLTGTPLENSVLDLWSIFDFLMPGYLGGAQEFRERYELPLVRDKSAAVQSRLARRLRPFLLRRLKREVAADLPAKIEQVSYCELGTEQRALYQQVLEASRREILDAVDANGLARSRMVVLTALLRLRQICCDPRLLNLPRDAAKDTSPQASGAEESCSESGTSSDPSPALPPSGKVELFGELLEEVLDGNHRVLVFSQFTAMLALLREELAAQSLEFCYLDGATKDRAQVVEKFQRESSIPIFLISLKAGGVGLNLTGADTVIHFDPWWNPAVEAQAIDRSHRIGQTQHVFAYRLICRDTVEEKILELQQKKRDLADAILNADNKGVIQNLTREDLEFLLS